MFKKLAFGPLPHVRTRPPSSPGAIRASPDDRPITPFFASFRLPSQPDEGSTKSVDFAKDQ
jgi:hypothetical protein